MVYFLVGSGVTRIGMARKEAAGIAEKRSGARGPENVWGSALTATLCAIGRLFSRRAGLGNGDHRFVDWLCSAWAYVASFSHQVVGHHRQRSGQSLRPAHVFDYHLAARSKRAPREPFSLEGTLAGVVGSAIIAAGGIWGTGLIAPVGHFLFACWPHSLRPMRRAWIGATLQDQFAWLTNELVNIREYDHRRFSGHGAG
jgi:uncharacterized protein (TIGR00297 family)